MWDVSLPSANSRTNFSLSWGIGILFFKIHPFTFLTSFLHQHSFSSLLRPTSCFPNRTSGTCTSICIEKLPYPPFNYVPSTWILTQSNSADRILRFSWDKATARSGLREGKSLSYSINYKGKWLFIFLSLQQALNTEHKTNDTQHIRFARVSLWPFRHINPLSGHCTHNSKGAWTHSLPSVPSQRSGSGARVHALLSVSPPEDHNPREDISPSEDC